MTNNHYDFSYLKILVVDDCTFMRRVLERMLNLLGMELISFAKDGAEALEAVKVNQPDIIICDWEMAPMDGPNFVYRLRQGMGSPGPYIPVIMLTGYTEKSKVLSARDFGITEFLAKPLSARALHNRIVSIIEKPRPFVRTKHFFGPCRRRLKLSQYTGEERREDELIPLQQLSASDR